jgi:Tfp pilus assembly protein PilO
MRLFVSLLIIVLIFVNIQQFFNALIPAYKNYLKSVQNKNEAYNKLKKVEFIGKFFDDLKNKKANEISSINQIEEKGELDILLPQKFEDYELVLIINSIFRSSGFNDPNIYQFQEEKLNHPQLSFLNLIKKNFSIKMVGNYGDVINLIKNFENHSRIFEFNKINLSKAEDKIDLSADLGVYYLGEIKPLLEK